MTKLNGMFDKVSARLPDRPAVLRAAVAVAAGALALWALGVALTLVLAALVGGLALAAGIAVLALAGELIARWKPEVVRAATDDVVGHSAARGTD